MNVNGNNISLDFKTTDIAGILTGFLSGSEERVPGEHVRYVDANKTSSASVSISCAAYKDHPHRAPSSHQLSYTAHALKLYIMKGNRQQALY